MAKWHLECDIDGGKFEQLMEILVPLNVRNLGFKIIAGSSKKLRAGDKPAWAMVLDLATDKPQSSAVFHEALRKAGHKDAHSGIQAAVEKRLIRKVKGKDGKTNIVRTAQKG